ncbi:M20/M25/M40 family metallo-hydrolase [Peribacillus frigoritolerans]|nr:M20/M25/M40 family metallo-hydrolase [Peribacillus frigoritolerans]
MNTTAFISNILTGNQCTVKTFRGLYRCGWRNGDGAFTVGLRSDIDALWQEVQGTFQANHSCGHDGHMTLALGVFLVLKEMGFRPRGKLKFIFQPAEEKRYGRLEDD